MAINTDQVRKIADLARLRLSPDEEQKLAEQMTGILAYVEQLTALDVSQVEPMTHALAGDPAPLREDAVRPGLAHADALANAPAKSGTSFKVPKIIE